MIMPSARWIRRIAVAAAVLLASSFAVGSLVRDGDRETALKSALPGAYDVASSDSAGTASSLAGRTGAGTGTTLDVAAPAAQSAAIPPLPDRIVKTGDLSIEVSDERFESAWSRAHRIATSFGGYVASSSRGSAPKAEAAPRDRTGEITIRVPAARFAVAMDELRKIGKVLGDNISSQDVTQEFTDLESRLRNLKAQEAVLLRLMAQAKSVQDTLVVQQHLSNVQGEIEQIQGRLKVLRSLTELSTINVHLGEPGVLLFDPEEGPSFARAWETAVEGLVRIGTVAMIAGIWLTPFAILALVALAVLRRRPPVPEQG